LNSEYSSAKNPVKTHFLYLISGIIWSEECWTIPFRRIYKILFRLRYTLASHMDRHRPNGWKQGRWSSYRKSIASIRIWTEERWNWGVGL